MLRATLPPLGPEAKIPAMIGRHKFQILLNRHHGTPGVVVLPDNGFRRAKEEIASWPGYAPTPLLPLPDAA